MLNGARAGAATAGKIHKNGAGRDAARRGGGGDGGGGNEQDT